MRSGLALGAALALFALLSGCAAPRTAGITARPGRGSGVAALAITRVGVEPKTITLESGQQATIHYELSHPASVRVDVVDDEGHVVRELEPGTQAVGIQQVDWDARTASGQPVPGGVYRYVIRAQDTGGHRAVYDPSGETGGEELQPWKFVFDRETSSMRWVMPKAGYARLRIGIEGFPHLRTLLDWEPLEAGEHTMVWDGLDASGLIHLKDHPHLSVKLSVFAMPDNTIIVRSSRPGEPPAGPVSYPPAAKGGSSYLHARHPRRSCHEVRLHVEFPSAVRSDDTGRPVLSGTVPVRVRLDAHDARDAINSRFEVALYEDTTFLFEEEDGADPFTYLWDTAHLPAGAHLLTVNILTYDDHYGVATQPVMIEEAR